MPRKDRNQDDEPEVPNTEEAAPEPVVAAPSLEGLVKMKRDGQIIHAHPATIHEHLKNGWKQA